MSYDKTCTFCNPVEDQQQHIIFENEHCMFLQHDSQQHILEGSGVIVPKKHRVDTFELTAEEWNASYELLHNAKAYLEEKYSPDGYTIGWNVGKASNQEIPHSHLHIIPRYNDEPYAGKGIRYWLKQPETRREKFKNLKFGKL